MLVVGLVRGKGWETDVCEPGVLTEVGALAAHLEVLPAALEVLFWEGGVA